MEVQKVRGRVKYSIVSKYSRKFLKIVSIEYLKIKNDIILTYFEYFSKFFEISSDRANLASKHKHAKVAEKRWGEAEGGRGGGNFEQRK